METEQYFDEEFVQQVRTRLLDDYDQNNHLYDTVDIEKLMTNDWFVRRYLAWKPTTIDNAVQCVHEAMKWRKILGINNWQDTDFPLEFYQMAACFSYLPDREDKKVIIVRLKTNKKYPLLRSQFEDLARKYFIYVCDKIVDENHNIGFGIIFDCHKASLSNVDLDFARFIVSTLSNYFAGSLSYVCVYELPWIFNQIWKLVRSWLDSDAKKLVRLATKKDIHRIIDTENLPDYMGGIGSKNYRQAPKGVPNVEELANQLGISCETDVKKIVSHFQQIIKEEENETDL